MRRGGSLLVVIIALLASFYMGMLYERNSCRIELPHTISAIDNAVRCS